MWATIERLATIGLMIVGVVVAVHQVLRLVRSVRHRRLP